MNTKMILMLLCTPTLASCAALEYYAEAAEDDAYTALYAQHAQMQEEIIAARSMIANLENQVEFLRVEVKELRRGNLGEIKKELASARAHAATLFQLVATKNRIIEEQAATMKKFIKNPHKVPFDPTKTMKSTKR